MQDRNLTCTMRKEFKTGAARRLRRDGKIPAIIYGHQKPVAITVDAHEFQTKFRIISENIIINLNVDGNAYDVLVKDYQEDLIKDKITHIDFFEIEKGKLLKTHVPVHITGTAVGVKIGGVFEALMHEVEVECLPKDLPEKIEVNINELDLGKSVHVKDLALPAEVKVITPENLVICHVIKKKDTVETGSSDEKEEAAAPVAQKEEKKS